MEVGATSAKPVYTEKSLKMTPALHNHLLLKVTQINYVSRNQLHNATNDCEILNFGSSWPG